jgi:formate hydrogenlyase transcriptional activator
VLDLFARRLTRGGASLKVQRAGDLEPTPGDIAQTTKEECAAEDEVGASPASDDGEIVALRAIVEGTARSTGEAFFESLVSHLAAAMGVSYAFVAEFAGAETRVRTLAYCGKGESLPNVEFELAGTPCEDVVRGGLCHHPLGVRRKFPSDRDLIDLGIESYLGVPLLDSEGKVLGHLAVFDERPMPLEPRRLFIFRIFATRAAVELDRLRGEQRLLESERRYRDLYEEAPNAYVSFGSDGTLINVNRRATHLLGYSVEELSGSGVLRYFADTPRGREPAGLALSRVLAGDEVSGLELEMRRRDGRPLWVNMWMRPLRDEGGATRAVHSIWVDVTDRVLAEAEKARLSEENLYLQEEIKSVHNFGEIVGRGPALAAVLEKVRRVAATDATVLISGETGTGKELIARAIHSTSERRDKPLIKVNCAALPAGLVESELFGHEKGAFTGAIARHTGRFELADGGTLFLDEIGELPADSQAKLLRVLQDHEFDRVGGTTPRKVDVRVIAATNRDLLKAASFRSRCRRFVNVPTIFRFSPCSSSTSSRRAWVGGSTGSLPTRFADSWRTIGRATSASFKMFSSARSSSQPAQCSKSTPTSSARPVPRPSASRPPHWKTWSAPIS